MPSFPASASAHLSLFKKITSRSTSKRQLQLGFETCRLVCIVGCFFPRAIDRSSCSSLSHLIWHKTCRALHPSSARFVMKLPLLEMRYAQVRLRISWAFFPHCGGMLLSLVGSGGANPIKSYRAVVIAYAVLGMVLTLVFAPLSSATEVGAAKIAFQVSRLKRLSSGFTLARDRPQAIGIVCPRSLKPAALGGDLLWSELICWRFRAVGLPARIAVWARKNDGLHTSTFEYSAAFATAHAPLSTCDRGFTVAIQHQPNGRTDEAVLHDGSCSSRRAICRSRNHGSNANNRRLHPTDVCWPHIRQAAFDQR